jgi:hypothetical protein
VEADAAGWFSVPVRSGVAGASTGSLGSFKIARACLQNARGAAARDLGWERGGVAGVSPLRATMAATTKLPA